MIEPLLDRFALAQVLGLSPKTVRHMASQSNCNKCRAVEGVASGAAVCAETMPHTEAQMARKFIVGSYHNTHVVYEIVRGGERAVSPSYSSKEAAHSALVLLQQNPAVNRTKE